MGIGLGIEGAIEFGVGERRGRFGGGAGFGKGRPEAAGEGEGRLAGGATFGSAGDASDCPPAFANGAG